MSFCSIHFFFFGTRTGNLRRGHCTFLLCNSVLNRRFDMPYYCDSINNCFRFSSYVNWRLIIACCWSMQCITCIYWKCSFWSQYPFAKGLLLHFKKRIPHVMISILGGSVVDREFDHRSGEQLEYTSYVLIV